MFTFETIPLGALVTYKDSTGEVRSASVYKKVERFKQKYNRVTKKWDQVVARTISVEYEKPLYPGCKSKWPCRTALSKFTNIISVE